MFYVCGSHVLCIVLILFIYPYIGKHDVDGGKLRFCLDEMSKSLFLCNLSGLNMLLTQFLCIVPLLNKYPLVESMVWV